VPQDLTQQEFNTGITFRDGDAWTLRFASNYLRDELDDYFVEGTYRLNEVYQATARLRYDSVAHRFDEQSYGIRQNVGNAWRVEYLVTIYDGPRRESHFGFNIQIDAIRF